MRNNKKIVKYNQRALSNIDIPVSLTSLFISLLYLHRPVRFEKLLTRLDRTREIY